MKPKYESNVEPKLFLIECWARDGLSDKQISLNLGIAYSTFRDYRAKYPALSAALKKGKEIIDYEVENALLKRALGYDYTEEKIEVETNNRGKVIGKKVVQVIKHVPADTTALAIWLNNRRSDRWRRNAGKEMLDRERFEEEKKVNGKRYW